MTPSERALAASIRQTIGKAYQVVSEIEDLVHNGTMTGYEAWEIDDEIKERETGLGGYVQKLFREIKILAERLNLSDTVADIKEATPTREGASETIHSPEGDYSSPHITTAIGFLESLEALSDGKDVTGLNIFETFLSNTAKVIAAFELEPKNEHGVQDAMAIALKFAFPDVVRDISISKNVKVYKPDFGVRSLRAAVEYKFIDSATEAKKALDETYTDMKGYAGTFEWRHFYAVYYMADAFVTQREIDAEYKLTKANSDWTPLVVVGRGARKRQRLAQKKKAKASAKKKAADPTS